MTPRGEAAMHLARAGMQALTEELERRLSADGVAGLRGGLLTVLELTHDG